LKDESRGETGHSRVRVAVQRAQVDGV
jgi:hypothetical protein